MLAVTRAGFGVWELRRTDPFIDVRVFAGSLPLLATDGRAVLRVIVA